MKSAKWISTFFVKGKNDNDNVTDTKEIVAADDFLEKLPDMSITERILKTAIREYFAADNLYGVRLYPNQIPCDNSLFMDEAENVKDIAVNIGGKNIRLFDYARPKWCDNCYYVFYVSDELKKMKFGDGWYKLKSRQL